MPVYVVPVPHPLLSDVADSLQSTGHKDSGRAAHCTGARHRAIRKAARTSLQPGGEFRNAFSAGFRQGPPKLGDQKTGCSVASSSMAFCAWDGYLQEEIPLGLQLQASGVLSIVYGAAHGPDRRLPGRARDPLGPDPPLGRVGACPLAVLDGRVPGADREGPYHHPHHDRAVLCEPGGRPASHETRSNRGRSHLSSVLAALSISISISTSSALRVSIWIAPRPATSRASSRSSRLPLPRFRPWSRRAVGASAVHCATGATGRRVAMAPGPRGMIPGATTAPSSARPRAASVQQRLALGERAGPQVRRIGARVGAEGEAPTLPGTRWARGHGFALHANPQILAHHRAQLERLRRETARGAVSLERLIQATNGALVYPFPHPWADGPTGRRRSPVALLETLAALGPLPRGHLGRSGGGLAAHSSVRRALTPPPRQHGIDAPAARPESPRWRWARLLQRVFAWRWRAAPGVPRGRCGSSRPSRTARGAGNSSGRCRARRGGPAPAGPGACPPSRLRLGLRLRCPRCRPGGEAAWPRGGSVLSGQQPARAARPGSLSPPGSPRLAQPQPLRSVVVWARGLQPAQTGPDG